jgi:TPP-dependent pyruvate/acetoin dehydrogenase alpha subunit
MVSKMKELGKNKLIGMYETMVRIRYFEEKVCDLFSQGKCLGFIHSSIGQEAVAVGVCSVLRKDDYITATHRGHHELIAKGGHMDKMMAELYGKKTGYNKGKGGSMHLTDVDLGILGMNGIVPAGLPIATGAGLSIKLRGTNQVAVSFFGDGGSNRGPFHESLNLASIWKLPVIYICENNMYAISMPQTFGVSSKIPSYGSQNISDISGRASAYSIPGVTVDGNDVMAVYGAAREAVKLAKSGKGPTLIECKTYRWRGHFEGDPAVYRTPDELEKWKKNDPITRFRKQLMERGFLLEADVRKIDKSAREEVENAVKFAEESLWPEGPAALEDLYTMEGV